MESLALLVSIIFLSFLLVGPVALGISFTRAPGWLSLILGFVAISAGLYALVAFGGILPFVFLGFLDLGCGFIAIYRVFTSQ